MVAHLLGLKLRLLGNLFRRTPWQVFGIIVGLLYGLGVTYAATTGLIALRGVEVEPARSIVVVVGSLIVLGFLFTPLVFGADDTMGPRKFALLGLPTTRLTWGLAAAAFVGVPALLIAIVAITQVGIWNRDAASTWYAVAAVLLIVVTCVLGARVMTSVATLLVATRRARFVFSLIGLIALCALSPVIAVMVTVDWEARGFAVLSDIADVLALTPLGAAWAAPANAAAGDIAAATASLAIALGFVILLAILWRILVGVMLATMEREPRIRSHTGLGWFSLLPGRPAAVIGARSLTYWARDGRYRAALAIVPIVPALIIAALTIAGVPMHFLVLLPIPVMCLFLAWSTVHNDVAFDNTAIWLHVAAGTAGWADRLGRIIPPLILGLAVIAIGTPFAAWGFGSADVIPALIGVSCCVLLAGLGVSSVFSAGFPYPAVHPDASPFAHPQSGGTAASWAQGLSFLFILALSAPTVWFAVRGLQDGGSGHVMAFAVGLGTGFVVLGAGVLLGGLIFARRAPELLAFTARY